MANSSPSTPTSHKHRQLRSAPQTMRERAEQQTAHEQRKQLRRPSTIFGRVWHTVRHTIAAPFRWIARWSFWRLKPVRVTGHVLAIIVAPPYLRGSWRELRQVDWPNRKQTRQLTGAVIMFAVVFGLLVAALDYGLDRLFKQVIVK